jgi:hypothetical protein
MWLNIGANGLQGRVPKIKLFFLQNLGFHFFLAYSFFHMVLRDVIFNVAAHIRL